MKNHRSFSMRLVSSFILASSCLITANMALAGSGWGSGVDVNNRPVSIPTYYANSPAGPVPKLDNNGQPILDSTTSLPAMIDSGKALRKFVDTLPGIGSSKANNLGQYIPVAVPEKNWTNPATGIKTSDDYYEIAAVEFDEKMHSDLPKATHLRGYVQLETPTNGVANGSKHIQLFYPDNTPIMDANGKPVYAFDTPHHLGPIITATSGTAIRLKFTNYLPVGAGGELFIPVDKSITGAGLGPDGVTSYPQNRAEIHLVGGNSPWISAGNPHQWIAPAGEAAAYAAGLGNGASTQNVPDMANPGNGSVTLYFPNDISARFTFYQDRTSGLTRLNSYAGLEAAYQITDPIEQGLITSGVLPADQIPLIIEDKTFVPQNISQQDAKWDTTHWGKPGDLWFPHVYETNQNPNSLDGTNPVGRWDYGPWFWPIFAATAPLPSGSYGDASFTPEAYADTPVINGTAYPTLTVDPKAYRFRILNASNDRFINLGLYKADLTTQAPQLDQNGNPIEDAHGNQLYFTGTEVRMVPAVADINGNPPNPSNVGAGLPYDPACLCQYPSLPQLQPAIQFSGPNRAWPSDGRIGGVPDPTAVGPDMIAIGDDGGFLPNPVDIPSQPVTYEQNRRSVTVSNIYGYGMLLGPAERSDVIVDFSKYAGQTLILYNDAPAPVPFNDQRNDYYTGDPDQTGIGGAYSTKPGYGPNTRTMMQIKVNAANPSSAYDVTALANALPVAYGASQPKPVVPESAYNAAFGTNDADTYAHVATGSAAQPNLDFSTSGMVTITGINIISSSGTGTGSGTGYDTANPPIVNFVGGGGVGAMATAVVDPVSHQVTAVNLTNPGSGYTSAPAITFTSQTGVGAQATAVTSTFQSIPVLTKAEQELFDAAGRYNSSGGVELPYTTATNQTTIPLNYIDAPTEFINDGETVLWKIVDNGLWSNSMHFDFVDVQLINRVGWDGTVKVPASNEVGWKDTLRQNPLEDVIIAMRAKRPATPFGLPISSRAQDPSVQLGAAGSGLGFTADPGVVSPTGQALLTTTTNVTTNYDNEYVWNSAILGHSEDDLMRPIVFHPSVVLPDAPTNLADPGGTATLTWTDPTSAVPGGQDINNVLTGGVPAGAPNASFATNNPKNEIGFRVLQGTVDQNGVAGFNNATVVANLPANATNWTIPTPTANTAFEVVAYNTAGTSAASNAFIETIPTSPIDLATAPSFMTPATNVNDVVVTLNWTNTAPNVSNFVIMQNGTQIATIPGTQTSYAVSGLTENTLYNFSVFAKNAFGISIASPTSALSLTTPISVPLRPTGLVATTTPAAPGSKPINNILLSWTNAAFNATSLTLSRNGVQIASLTTVTTSYVDTTAMENVPYTYTLVASNSVSTPANAAQSTATLVYTMPLTAPLAPSNLAAAPSNVLVNFVNNIKVDLSWVNNAYNAASYNVVRNGTVIATVASGTATSYTDLTAKAGTTYSYQVVAVNAAGSTVSNLVSTTVPGVQVAAPTGLTALPNSAGTYVTLNWIDNSNNEDNFLIVVSVNGGPYSLVRTLASTTKTSTGGPVTVAIPTTAGNAYSIQVYAQNVAAITQFLSNSNPASVAINLVPTVPAIPTGLNDTIDSNGIVTFSWNAVTGATGGYQIVINDITTGTSSTLSIPAQSTTSATANPVNGDMYSVTIAAVATSYGLTVTSAPSAPITVDLTIPAQLAAPSNLTVVHGTAAQAKLNWGLVSGATAYIVQFSTNGGPFTNMATLGSTVSTYTASSYMSYGNNYAFQVLAQTILLGKTITSAPSNVVQFYEVPNQSTMPIATAGAAGSQSIAVKWTNNSSNITSWTIQRGVIIGGLLTWSTIVPTPTIAQSGISYSFIDTGLTTGTSYRYHVMATSLGGNTAYSANSTPVAAP